MIRPVPFADWAAPIVPIVKEDGTVRICGDYKLTVNQASKLESYPVPRVEDLFASLSGGRLFSKIDLTNAYQQMRLDDASKAYTTITRIKVCLSTTDYLLGWHRPQPCFRGLWNVCYRV